MSYDVDLINADGEIVEVENHEEGGTYALGGTNWASLNVAWNYGKQYWRKPIDGGLGEGLKTLHKQRAGDVIDLLENSVKILGTKTSDDYWEDTDGNAGHALNILLKWAEQHPDAIFSVQ